MTSLLESTISRRNRDHHSFDWHNCQQAFSAVFRSSECSLHTRLFVQSDRDCRQFCEDTADCRFYYWSPFSLFLEHFLVKDVAKIFKPREFGIFSMLLHMPTHYFCRKSRQKIVLQVPHRLLALPPLLLSLPQVLRIFCRKLFPSQIFELL